MKPPNVQRLGPRALTSAVRAMRQDFRRRGLLQDGVRLEGIDLDEETDALEAEVASGKLTPRRLSRAPSVVAWLGEQGESDRAQELLSDLVRLRVVRSPRLWWTAACYLRDPRALITLERARPPRDRLARRYPHAATAEDLSELDQHLANVAVQSGLPLHEAFDGLSLPPVGSLRTQVLGHLHSPSALPWLLAHSVPQLTAAARAFAETPEGAQLVDALLAPIRRRGATPADVAKGRPLAQVVAAIRHALPDATDGSLWRSLSDDAAELLRWWQVQQDLSTAFEQWRSEPERMAFWRGYIRSIADIAVWQDANALVIRLNDDWYVEIGRTGFATYVFSDQEMRRHRRTFEAAIRPDIIRDRAGWRRLEHRGYSWAENNAGKIARWSGVRRQGYR